MRVILFLFRLRSSTMLRTLTTALLIVSVFFATVCTTETKTDKPKYNTPQVSGADNLEDIKSNDPMESQDPCSVRLHDIEGALLMYFMINKHYPDTLEELRSVADVDTDLKFTCPVSNQAYGYAPRGMRAPGRQKLVIVWDTDTAHAGRRNCIMAVDTPNSHAPQSLEVLSIPEPVFLSYQSD